MMSPSRGEVNLNLVSNLVSTWPTSQPG